MANHVCGKCFAEFNTEDQYLDHECPDSGFTPRDPENLGDEFVAVSEAAVARGNARKQLEENGVDAEEAKTLTSEVTTAEEAEKVVTENS